MYQSILVPVDGSRHSEQSLAVAAQLARASSARLHLMTVAEFPPDNIGLFLGGTAEPFSEEQRERLARAMKEEAHRVLDKALGSVDLSGIEVERHVEQGRPAETIVEKAGALGVDAIVMGGRGVSDLAGMVFGSVSHRVSHTAECPVITVT